MEELRPCPFCGSKTAPIVETYAEAIFMDEENLPYGWAKTHYIAVCNYNNNGCGASTTANNITKEEAVARWNRRANDV